MRTFIAASAVLLLTTSCASSFRCPAPFPVTVPTAFHWGCPAVRTPVLAMATNTSVTNQANGNLSVLFSKTSLDLQQQTTALNGSAAAFLDFPIRTNAGSPTGVTCHLGGFVAKSERAAANIFVELGGHAVLLEFPAGMAIEQDVRREISFTVPATQPQSWPLTVVINATRPDTTSAVRAVVDEVDCAIRP